MTVVAPIKKPAWGPRPRVRILRTSPDDSRPLTATLDHPLVLNAALLTKLDMTAFTKEGLRVVTKLCTIPIIQRQVKPNLQRGARKTAKEVVEDVDTSSSEMSQRSVTKPAKQVKRGAKTASFLKVEDVFGSSLPLPEPCRTCGRPEQPERLHSHPPISHSSAKAEGRKPVVRSPITKPVPAKSATPEATRKTEDVGISRPRSSRPRTVTCYICSREFGTTSFPLHEPKCMEKWHRENQQLPRELRRKPPVKPSAQVGGTEWNESAWQASQSALVPCNGCGRTFNPDRLAVHARSCKGSGSEEATRPTTSPQVTHSAHVRPPTVPCYICGREFGSRSIAIHEPQCLRKWRLDNSHLPQALQRPEPQKPELDLSRLTGCYICGEQVTYNNRMAHERSCLQTWRRANSARPEGERLQEPQRPDYRFTGTGDVDYYATWHSIWANHMDSLIPCRSCGRKFFPDRIQRHETACSNLPMKSKTTR